MFPLNVFLNICEFFCFTVQQSNITSNYWRRHCMNVPPPSLWVLLMNIEQTAKLCMLAMNFKLNSFKSKYLFWSILFAHARMFYICTQTTTRTNVPLTMPSNAREHNYNYSYTRAPTSALPHQQVYTNVVSLILKL